MTTGRPMSCGSTYQARSESITRSMMSSMPKSSVFSDWATACRWRERWASVACRSEWMSLDMAVFFFFG